MKIVIFGEGMIEIGGGIGPGGYVAFAGDVLNVGVGLARLGYRPAILTALGEDRWSNELIAAWAEEGLDTALIARHPTRAPGVYGVTTDAEGERSFTYWREQSAARALFTLPQIGELLDIAAAADLLFLSGITLSLYDVAARARITELAKRVRLRGGAVAFDGNYRPRGWASPAEARAAFDALAPQVAVALPTLEDEIAVYGDSDPQAITARWHARGAAEVIVKMGPNGAYVSAADINEVVPTVPVTPVDTSGAGDAFDAAYLAARLAGQSVRGAATFANRLAGEAIHHRGSIPPRDVMIRAAQEAGGL